MKYSLAIVALLSVASAIKIREDPAFAAAAPAAPAAPEKAAVDVNAKAAADAGKPPAPADDPANPGKAVVAEALKTEE